MFGAADLGGAAVLFTRTAALLLYCTGLGFSAAARKAAEVFALVWAGSQVGVVFFSLSVGGREERSAWPVNAATARMAWMVCLGAAQAITLLADISVKQKGCWWPHKDCSPDN